MSENKYLNINHKQLFEKHTVDEIVAIQKEVQYEIDKKKQELRTMVGERYRDVITASDTIKCMQETVYNVVVGIGQIVDICNEIKNMRTIQRDDYQLSPAEYDQELHQNAMKSKSIQIKILVYIPEQIWGAIDDKDYLKATKLFLFARHIYTGLRSDASSDNNAAIVHTQWTKIGHFEKRIMTHVVYELQRNDITVEFAAEYLVAYVLLEHLKGSDLLLKFIDYRKMALENVLRDDLSAHNTVKSQTCIALKSIINTIELLYICFIDCGSGKGMVYEKLNNIVTKTATPTLDLVELMPDPLISCLPPIVSEFRPIMKYSLESIIPDNAGASISMWLDWVNLLIDSEISKLLNLVTSIKSLDSIREEALKIQLVDHWEIICQQLSLARSFNVWFQIFQPLITSRVNTLIETKWNEIISITEREISDALANASSGKTAKPELDLRWFVWKEEKGDVPSKLSLDGEHKFVAKGLMMKSNGYSPNVMKLCESFDSQLTMLLGDLEVYIYGNDNNMRAKYRADYMINKLYAGNSTFNKFSDKNVIQEHLQKISRENIERLVGNIMQSAENSDLTQSERLSYYLMTARLLLAVPQLCPNLIKCFQRDGKHNAWNDMCTLLAEKRGLIWDRWLDVMMNRLSHLINNTFVIDFSIDTVLEYLPQWSVIDIEEQNDETTIKSQIRVPSQPNFHLQNLLFQICAKLNTVIPHTLPNHTHVKLVEGVMERIFAIYERLCSHESLIQAQALQFLMDVKYLVVMFVRRDQVHLTAKTERLCETLRLKIDPFDYNVFYPYMQKNITTSAQRTQNILGVLIPNADHLTTMLGARQSGAPANSTTSTPDKDSMAVALSDCVGVWFPLLPVTAPVAARSRHATVPAMARASADKRQPKKSSPMHEKKTTEQLGGNLVRSGAASFLAEWFG